MATERDKLIVQLFASLKELSELRRNYDSSVKDGYFNITRTRYNTGSLSAGVISQVQYPSEMTAQTLIECCDGDTSGTSDQFRLSHESISTNPIKINESNSSQLRQRKGEKAGHGTPSSSLSDDNGRSEREHVTMETIDPIKWFAALPPQTLRSSQSQFKQGIEFAIAIANVQQRIKELRRKFITLSSDNVTDPETLKPTID